MLEHPLLRHLPPLLSLPPPPPHTPTHGLSLLPPPSSPSSPSPPCPSLLLHHTHTHPPTHPSQREQIDRAGMLRLLLEVKPASSLQRMVGTNRGKDARSYCRINYAAPLPFSASLSLLPPVPPRARRPLPPFPLSPTHAHTVAYIVGSSRIGWFRCSFFCLFSIVFQVFHIFQISQCVCTLSNFSPVFHHLSLVVHRSTFVRVFLLVHLCGVRTAIFGLLLAASSGPASATRTGDSPLSASPQGGFGSRSAAEHSRAAHIGSIMACEDLCQFLCWYNLRWPGEWW